MEHTDSLGRTGEINATQINTSDSSSLHIGNNYNFGPEYNRCLADLRLTDPVDHKLKIEYAKGRLIEDAYKWILENAQFQQWRNSQDPQFLRIEGTAGKGKTMLLCGIINELQHERTKSNHKSNVVFFFCEETDDSNNSATGVLRGLIYRLVQEQVALFPHVKNPWETAGGTIFRDSNAAAALKRILVQILADPALLPTVICIDGLDECVRDRMFLFDLIAEHANCPRVKWIISSRPEIDVVDHLQLIANHAYLELNDKAIGEAVEKYIKAKVSEIAAFRRYPPSLKQHVHSYLSDNAQYTFLWVALVCKELRDVERTKAGSILGQFPSGLNKLYDRSMTRLLGGDGSGLRRRLLRLAATVYRPVSLKEVSSLIPLEKYMIVAGDDQNMEDTQEDVSQLVKSCGVFLQTMHDGTETYVQFVHQSAKGFLVERAFGTTFPGGVEAAHREIFQASLDSVIKLLRKKNIHKFEHTGCAIQDVKPPQPDPLAPIEYACLYWIEHLSATSVNNMVCVKTLLLFFETRFIFWLESLALLRSVSRGIASLGKILELVKICHCEARLVNFVQDAYRFAMYFKTAIETHPLQLYASALAFAPIKSYVRNAFWNERTAGIAVNGQLQRDWSPCLYTLFPVFKSRHSVWAAGVDRVIVSDIVPSIYKWDQPTDHCLQMFPIETLVEAIAVSQNGHVLACLTSEYVELWDVDTGHRCKRLHLHPSMSGGILPWSSIDLSTSGSKLALSRSGIIEVWDLSHEDHRTRFPTAGDLDHVSLSLSPDGSFLAVAAQEKVSRHSRAYIWDWMETGRSTLLYDEVLEAPRSVTFSQDGVLLGALIDGTLIIWERSQDCWVQKGRFENARQNGYGFSALAFSPDSRFLALGVENGDIQIWERKGSCFRLIESLEEHLLEVRSVAFSLDSRLLVSACEEVKFWQPKLSIFTGAVDQALQTSNESQHIQIPVGISVSPEGSQLAVTRESGYIELWNAHSGYLERSLNLELAHEEDLCHKAVYSDDGIYMAAVVSTCRRVNLVLHIIDLMTSCITTETLREIATPETVHHLSFSPENRYVAILASTSYTSGWIFDRHQRRLLNIRQSMPGPYAPFIAYGAFSSMGDKFVAVEGNFDDSDHRTEPLWLVTAMDLDSGTIDKTFLLTEHPADLDTTQGVLNLLGDFASQSESSSVLARQQPQYSISQDKAWIEKGSRKIIWIPPEYRFEDLYRGGWDPDIKANCIALITKHSSLCWVRFT